VPKWLQQDVREQEVAAEDVGLGARRPAAGVGRAFQRHLTVVWPPLYHVDMWRMAGTHVGRGVRVAKGSLLRTLCASGLILLSAPAAAFDASGGVGFGGALAGTRPRLAVSPHVSLSWRKESGLLFAVHEMCSILPAINEHGPGVYNQASAAVGYASVNANFSIGPSLSIYSISACNARSCGRVLGLSPGA